MRNVQRTGCRALLDRHHSPVVLQSFVQIAALLVHGAQVAERPRLAKLVACRPVGLKRLEQLPHRLVQPARLVSGRALLVQTLG